MIKICQGNISKQIGIFLSLSTYKISLAVAQGNPYQAQRGGHQLLGGEEHCRVGHLEPLAEGLVGVSSLLSFC